MTAAVVYLLRHGRTAMNAAGLLRGQLDPPLDAVGEAEAEALAATFEGLRTTEVRTSPLRRAVQTAEPVAAMLGVPLVFDERLIDRDFGPWAGHERAAVERRFGSIAAAPGIEPFDAFTGRVIAALDHAADRADDAAVVVVAHEAVNRVALGALVPVLGEPEAITQRTGCWNHLERSATTWRAVVVDAVPKDDHRPPSTPRSTP